MISNHILAMNSFRVGYLIPSYVFVCDPPSPLRFHPPASIEVFLFFSSLVASIHIRATSSLVPSLLMWPNQLNFCFTKFPVMSTPTFFSYPLTSHLIHPFRSERAPPKIYLHTLHLLLNFAGDGSCLRRKIFFISFHLKYTAYNIARVHHFFIAFLAFAILLSASMSPISIYCWS